jgi:dimethylaniline monooxygenase (N-oxide forming)
VPADLLIHATGPQQHLPYLEVDVLEQLLDGRGNLAVYRQVHPVGVPDLSFAGPTPPEVSLRDAELVAAWTAARLAGLFDVPEHHHLVDLTTVPGANPAGPHARGVTAELVPSRYLEEIHRDLRVVVGEGPRSGQRSPWNNAHLVLEVERRILAAGVVSSR